MADAVFGFTRKDAEALLRLIGGETDSTARTTDTYDATACYLAVATTTITAYSAVTKKLGSGQAQFKYINALDEVEDSWINTVYNFGTPIQIGARLLTWRVGNRFIAVELC